MESLQMFETSVCLRYKLAIWHRSWIIHFNKTVLAEKKGSYLQNTTAYFLSNKDNLYVVNYSYYLLCLISFNPSCASLNISQADRLLFCHHLKRRHEKEKSSLEIHIVFWSLQVQLEELLGKSLYTKYSAKILELRVLEYALHKKLSSVRWGKTHIICTSTTTFTYKGFALW